MHPSTDINYLSKVFLSYVVPGQTSFVHAINTGRGEGNELGGEKGLANPALKMIYNLTLKPLKDSEKEKLFRLYNK